MRCLEVSDCRDRCGRRIRPYKPYPPYLSHLRGSLWRCHFRMCLASVRWKDARFLILGATDSCLTSMLMASLVVSTLLKPAGSPSQRAISKSDKQSNSPSPAPAYPTSAKRYNIPRLNGCPANNEKPRPPPSDGRASTWKENVGRIFDGTCWRWRSDASSLPSEDAADTLHRQDGRDALGLDGSRTGMQESDIRVVWRGPLITLASVASCYAYRLLLCNMILLRPVLNTPRDDLGRFAVKVLDLARNPSQPVTCITLSHLITVTGLTISKTGLMPDIPAGMTSFSAFIPLVFNSIVKLPQHPIPRARLASMGFHAFGTGIGTTSI